MLVATYHFYPPNDVGTHDVDVKLADLMARPHSEESFDPANAKCPELVGPGTSAHQQSGKWVDSEGNTMLCYLSFHYLRNGKRRIVRDEKGQAIKVYDNIPVLSSSCCEGKSPLTSAPDLDA